MHSREMSTFFILCVFPLAVVKLSNTSKQSEYALAPVGLSNSTLTILRGSSSEDKQAMFLDDNKRRALRLRLSSESHRMANIKSTIGNVSFNHSPVCDVGKPKTITDKDTLSSKSTIATTMSPPRNSFTLSSDDIRSTMNNGLRAKSGRLTHLARLRPSLARSRREAGPNNIDISPENSNSNSSDDLNVTSDVTTAENLFDNTQHSPVWTDKNESWTTTTPIQHSALIEDFPIPSQNTALNIAETTVVDEDDFSLPGWQPPPFGTLWGNGGVEDQGPKQTEHEPAQCTGSESGPARPVELKDLCESDTGAWSCRQRCNHTSVGGNIRFTCSCHPSCVLHRFCCSDFESECPDEFQRAEEAGKNFPQISAACDSSLSSHVVSACPIEAHEDDKRLCLGESKLSQEEPKDFNSQNSSRDLGRSDGTADIEYDGLVNRAVLRLRNQAPVTDSVLGWHFKNRFCWRCWQTGNQAIQWRLEISMSWDTRPPEDYRLKTLTDFVENNPEAVAWFSHSSLARVPCVSDKNNPNEDVAAWCTACKVDPDTEEACVNGTASYLRADGLLYKNRHCLLCSKYHGFEDDSTSREGDQQFFGVLPLMIRPDKKYYCSPVEFFNNKAYHNMHFPVTMIIPDENSGAVELYQNSESVGSYSWDRLYCRNSEAESEGPLCVADMCNYKTVLSDGKCDENFYPLQAVIRICATNPKDDHLHCLPAGEESNRVETSSQNKRSKPKTIPNGTFSRARQSTNFEDVRQTFRDLGIDFGVKNFLNASLIQASIEDNPAEGLLLFLVWKIRKYSQSGVIDEVSYNMEQGLVEDFRWKAYTLVESVDISEPAFICVSWIYGAERPDPLPPIDIQNCDLIFPCSGNTNGVDTPKESGSNRSGETSGMTYPLIYLKPLLFASLLIILQQALRG